MAESKTKLSSWKRFMNLLSLERKDILQIFYYAIFSGLVALSLPLGIQVIINLIQGAQVSTSWIVLVSLVTLGVIFTGTLQLMQMRIIETIQQRIFARAAIELTYRFPKIKMSELRNAYPPELANRFFDTLNIQKGLSKILIDVPAAVLQIVFALVLLSFYHSFFILFGLALIVLMYLVFQYTVIRGLQTSLMESKYKYKVAHWIQEVARSIISFKVSGSTSLALEKNDKLVSEYLTSRENHFQIIKLQFIKMIGFKVLITAGLLLIGGILVLNQQINIGQFVAAEIIILLVIASVEKLIVALETFYDIITSIEKLGQVVDKELEKQDGIKPDFSGDFVVSLDEVAYEVPEKETPILKQVSLEITPKSRILVQGESGSGKSSLLRLISGLTTPTKGNVFVNNHTIKSLNPNYYRAMLGMSLSEETPFEDTLKNNLTFGNNTITDHEIFDILEIVGLSSFVRQLPQGLTSTLNPEGKQMSFTVSKKIILARAILKQPKILILEDALDQFNQEETQSIIDYLCSPERPWALLVVSGNPYWEKHITQIVQLKEGEIQN